MALRLLVPVLACAGRRASALLLNSIPFFLPFSFFYPPYTTSPADGSAKKLPPDAKVVKVLAYGDFWADGGKGAGVLETMFAEHNILADVRHVRRLAGACNLANDYPAGQSLVTAIKTAFGTEVPQYVWYSAGQQDLQFPHALQHPLECRVPPLDVERCMQAHIRDGVNHCTDLLLKSMWALTDYADIKVVQCGYDYPCSEGVCAMTIPPASLDRFCNGDLVCRHTNFNMFNKYLLGPQYHDLGEHAHKYTSINILGALQMVLERLPLHCRSSDALGQAHRPLDGGEHLPEPVLLLLQGLRQATRREAHGYENVTLGEPDTKKGSPCEDTYFCLSPKKNTKGYRAIAAAFWDLYFSHQDLSLYSKEGGGADGG